MQRVERVQTINLVFSETNDASAVMSSKVATFIRTCVCLQRLLATALIACTKDARPSNACVNFMMVYADSCALLTLVRDVFLPVPTYVSFVSW